MSKRLLAAALALYTIVVVSGAPLPLATLAAWCLPAVPQEAGAQRFPCEACPCGCGTAEHCWKKCCCHTLPERLAWARREGVRPPESALDSAEQAGLDVSHWREPRGFRVTLPAPIEEPAEHETDLADLPPCCRKARLAACCDTPRSENEPADQDPPADPGVALLSALACQGLAEAWLSLGEAPAVTPPELIEAPVLTVAADSPTPIWRTQTEAPTPPPPDGLS